MSTLMEELTALKTSEDKITGNKVANFAYDDYAYEHEDANGVDSYNVNNHQNIPNGTANILKVNPTILTKGWRAQASAITRMLIDHFLGRCSYNLNKINDHFSALLTKLMSYLGAPNGIATLDEDGNVPASQISLTKIGLDNVVNTGDSAVPTNDGTDKFTTGGMYEFIRHSALIWQEGHSYSKGTIVYHEGEFYTVKQTASGSTWDSTDFTRILPLGNTRGLAITRKVTISSVPTDNQVTMLRTSEFCAYRNETDTALDCGYNIYVVGGHAKGMLFTMSNVDNSNVTIKHIEQDWSGSGWHTVFSIPAHSTAFYANFAHPDDNNPCIGFTTY